ncbi:Rpn family recombination-promoting nuclease/putative transposase [Pigmentibacter ruber]
MQFELLDIKNDYVFKRIFGEKEDILIHFLNSVLNYPENEKIISLTYLNTEINKDQEDDKETRLDVLAKLNNESFVNIEIQVQNTYEYEKRCLYYWAKLYEQQLTIGKKYKTLKPAICIHILNFNFFKHKEHFFTKIKTLDIDTKYVFSTDFQLYFLEVPKIPDQYYNELDKWMHFFKGASKETVMAMQTPEIEKAFSTLEYISQDPIARAKYEARRKYELDYNTDMDGAREEGFTKGKDEGVRIGFAKGKNEGVQIGEYKRNKEIVLNLLANHFSIEMISKITDLPISEIEKLKNS